MEKSTEAQKNVKAVVESVKDYFQNPETRDLESLLATTVCPILEKELKDLCLRIEERHKIDKPESWKDRFIIHYTSISALVSMLQNASRSDKKSSLRLYDSVHSNDPGEGNYLTRDLLQGYKWLGKTDVRHAYIASFIFPNSATEKDDMSDDLVFWRTYGQEGEGCSLSLYAPLSRLLKVSYGPSSKNAEHTVEKLRSVLDLLDPLKINNPLISESIQEKLAETVCRPLERIRYLYKSNAYKHEKECRFVLLESDIDKDKICFEYQNRNNSLACIRHYFKHEALQIENLLRSGSSITLGPCVPYRDNVHDCIQTLNDRVDGLSTEIKFSKIPYRKS